MEQSGRLNELTNELKTNRKYKTTFISLDVSLTDDDFTLIDTLTDKHDDFAMIDFMDTFNLLIEPLNELDKQIAHKRFIELKADREIAEELEISINKVTWSIYGRIIPILKAGASVMEDFRK